MEDNARRLDDDLRHVYGDAGPKDPGDINGQTEKKIQTYKRHNKNNSTGHSRTITNEVECVVDLFCSDPKKLKTIHITLLQPFLPSSHIYLLYTVGGYVHCRYYLTLFAKFCLFS